MDEFKIVLVVVIFNKKTKKFLIGKRVNDKYVKNLSWSFIGGRLNYDENPKEKVCLLVRDSIGVEIGEVGLICSMPHRNQKNVFVNYFFYVFEDASIRPLGNFVDLKWVLGSELEDHFTTTLQPDVKKFIEEL